MTDIQTGSWVDKQGAVENSSQRIAEVGQAHRAAGMSVAESTT